MLHKDFTINTKLFADRFVQLQSGIIVEVKNFAVDVISNSETKIVGFDYEIINSYFSKPCLSSAIDVHEIKATNIVSTWDIKLIKRKLVVLPSEENYICFFLLHL